MTESDQERDWRRQLDRERDASRAFEEGLPFPGPGAAEAAAPSDGLSGAAEAAAPKKNGMNEKIALFDKTVMPSVWGALGTFLADIVLIPLLAIFYDFVALKSIKIKGKWLKVGVSNALCLALIAAILIAVTIIVYAVGHAMSSGTVQETIVEYWAGINCKAFK